MRGKGNYSLARSLARRGSGEEKAKRARSKKEKREESLAFPPKTSEDGDGAGTRIRAPRRRGRPAGAAPAASIHGSRPRDRSENLFPFLLLPFGLPWRRFADGKWPLPRDRSPGREGGSNGEEGFSKAGIWGRRSREKVGKDEGQNRKRKREGKK